jgi:hypothetical protein
VSHGPSVLTELTGTQNGNILQDGTQHDKAAQGQRTLRMLVLQAAHPSCTAPVRSRGQGTMCTENLGAHVRIYQTCCVGCKVAAHALTSMRLTALLFMSAENPWSLNTVRPSFRVSWNQSRHVTRLPAGHTAQHDTACNRWQSFTSTLTQACDRQCADTGML